MMTDAHDIEPAESRTEGDLLTAICLWKLDADMIYAIAEDLPDGALEDASYKIFGELGREKFLDLLYDVNDLASERDELFWRAIRAERGEKPFHN